MNVPNHLVTRAYLAMPGFTKSRAQVLTQLIRISSHNESDSSHVQSITVTRDWLRLKVYNSGAKAMHMYVTLSYAHNLLCVQPQAQNMSAKRRDAAYKTSSPCSAWEERSPWPLEYHAVASSLALFTDHARAPTLRPT